MTEFNSDLFGQGCFVAIKPHERGNDACGVDGNNS